MAAALLRRGHARAERLACDIAVDAFCGVGGNAVQLAGTCSSVIACDLSFERLLLAKHNADVYGVGSRIDFVCADFLRLSPRLRVRANIPASFHHSFLISTSKTTSAMLSLDR